jgi:TonB family protein
MKSFILLTALLFIKLTSSFGQTKILKGAVFNEKGNPLVAASIILIKNGKQNWGMGTRSEVDGTFSFKIPLDSKDSVLCTYIGYEYQYIKIDGSDSINITLRQKKERNFDFLKEDSSETIIRRIWGDPIKVKKVKKVSKVKKEILGEYIAPIPKPEEDYVFQKVEVNAEYPRGKNELTKFFEKNIVYSLNDTLQNVDGTVVAGFTIDRNGNPTNFKIIKSVNKFANEAVLKALRKMPQWRPAIQNGYTIEQYFEFAFQFKIKNTIVYLDDGRPSQ